MKRVLVVYFSQTGQLKRCVESFTAPLRESGELELDVVELQPETAYPFPWGMRSFLSVIPEAVLAEPAPLKAAAIDPARKYDLVILGYQVWYLSPAPPVVAFLRSPQAEALRGVPVVALCACRGMWQQAWKDLKALIAARGGRVIDHAVLVDRGPAWSTFYTTPRWLIAGKKAGGPFPESGVSETAIDRLREPGRLLKEALEKGALERSVFAGTGVKVIDVRRYYLLSEWAAKLLYRPWALALKAVPRPARYPLGLIWFAWLLCSLPLAIPIALAGEVLNLTGARWYRERLQELREPSGGAIR